MSDLSYKPLTETERALKEIRFSTPKDTDRILTGTELSEYIAHLFHTYHTGEDIPHLPDAGYYTHQSAASFIIGNRDISVLETIRYMPAHWFTSDYFVLYFPFSGTCEVCFEDSKVTLSSGSVLLVPPEICHATPCDSDDVVLVSYNIRRENFNQTFWNNLRGHDLMSDFFHRILASGRENRTQYLHFETGEDETIRHILTAIYEESRTEKPYHGQIMNGLMSTFFATLMRNYEKTVSFPVGNQISWKPEYSHIINYIQENFQTVTLKELSRRFHYSTRQLERIMKGCTGQSFSSAVTSLRMNLACELLRHTDLSTEKIAGETGYENISSFHRAFQKNVGMTPAKFRKKLKSGLGQRGFQNIKNTLC